MFEIGKKYEFGEVVLGDDGHYLTRFNDTVEAIENNLVKLKSGKILNTYSPLFHGAGKTFAQREGLEQ